MGKDGMQAQLVEFPHLGDQQQRGAPVMGNMQALQALQGVRVNLTVVLGQIKTSMGELMQLRQASVLELDRDVDSTVDVMVDGNVVARGQLVVVGERFGVRVTESAVLE